MKVEPVNLKVTLPSTHVKMVTMQPFVHLTKDEPFHWPDDKKEEQIQAIERTLEIARDNGPTHFTLFPEYSIPSLEGVNIINEAIESNTWPKGTVIIGGVDGLNKDQYAALCSQQRVVRDDVNKPDNVPDNKWVNCCITWVKDDAEQLAKYVQPKISPCWKEKKITCSRMFRGESIFVFRARYDKDDHPCRFLSMICFDWIGRTNGDTIVSSFLSKLNMLCKGTEQSIDCAFILQENDEPNDPRFLETTYDFLTNRSTYTLVHRADSAVIFVNNSGKNLGGKDIINTKGEKYRAYTSLIFGTGVSFRRDGCPPTFSLKSQKIRGSGILKKCYDAILRELRPCIHVCELNVSRFVTSDQTDPRHALREASVYPIGEVSDPRYPEAPVPASVKWVNDQLDELVETKVLGKNLYHDVDLAGAAASSHNEVSNKLRWLDGLKLQSNIHYATCNQSEEKWQDADEWGNDEKEALEHLLHTVTIMGIADTDINIKESVLHARIILEDKIIELVAINGNDHTECKKHFDANYVQHINHKKLIISRDSDNSEVLKRYTEKVTEHIIGEPSEGNKFTATHYSIFQRGYRDLLVDFKRSSSPQQLAERISSYVN